MSHVVYMYKERMKRLIICYIVESILFRIVRVSLYHISITRICRLIKTQSTLTHDFFSIFHQKSISSFNLDFCRFACRIALVEKKISWLWRNRKRSFQRILHIILHVQLLILIVERLYFYLSWFHYGSCAKLVQSRKLTRKKRKKKKTISLSRETNCLVSFQVIYK